MEGILHPKEFKPDNGDILKVDNSNELILQLI